MPAPSKVLVTGASGFVGSELCRQLSARGAAVVAAVRSAVAPGEAEVGAGAAPTWMPVGNIGPATDWSPTLAGVGVVVHLAARVHVMREQSADPLSAFRETNVQGTERLARAAAVAGVRRLVFVSSVKVNGEGTSSQPYRSDDLPQPQDAYAVSKWEAEQALRRIAAETGMEVVILRPPLVYGPGVKANFLRLLRWVDKGIPLPLASVKNQRSLIYLGNLVDALIASLQHPAAANNTYLVSDGKDVSTPELIRRIAAACGREPVLWPCPESVLRLLGAIGGRRAEVERLVGSLRLDSSAFRRDLHWAPPWTMTEGLRQTVAWYRGLRA